MRVLIGCESSGVVREAFRARGHDAWSCDLQPADDGSPYHFQEDIRFVLDREQFDFYGFHPDCTYVTGSGIHWNNRGRGWEKTEAAVAFVRLLMATNAPYYLENPVGILSTRIRKPDQIIQPYEFGEDASKKTCLWLNHLSLSCAPRAAVRVASSRATARPLSGGATRRTAARTGSALRRPGGKSEAAPTPASRKQWPRSGAAEPLN